MGNKFIAVIGADQSITSDGLANALAVTTSHSRLYSLTIFNSKDVAQYVQVHDVAATPDDGEVPKLCFSVAGNEAASLDFHDGRIFSNGIYICNSSTGETKTIGSADCIIDATFRKT